LSELAGGRLRGLQRLLDWINAALIALSAVAVAAAGCVLTWEVAGRYFLKIPSSWQDELSIFLLVGATFFSAAWIQARRGHVAIDAVAHLLPPGAERARRMFADFVTLAFCIFFAWKCWTLLLEALSEGQISNTPWGPPMWIPYGMMALGMTILAMQVALQFGLCLVGRAAR
jgi:TRAP-type C4-dicarboxylate transport system permease small subunit